MYNRRHRWWSKRLQEAPLAEQAPLVVEEEHFGWSSSDDEGGRNLEDNEDVAIASDKDESPQATVVG
jgi:hypothetical protein